MISPLKDLYCAHAPSSSCEYWCVFWDPSTFGASSMVRRVQRTLLRCTTFEVGILLRPHDYAPVLGYLNLSGLADLSQALNLPFNLVFF